MTAVRFLIDRTKVEKKMFKTLQTSSFLRHSYTLQSELANSMNVLTTLVGTLCAVVLGGDLYHFPKANTADDSCSNGALSIPTTPVTDCRWYELSRDT